MLLWETHLHYTELRSLCLRYVKVLSKVITVFLVSIEALLWMIIMFSWKCMNFMKCFCVKRTCVTLNWEAFVCDMSKYCQKLEQCSLFCRSFTLNDNHVLLKIYEFHEILLCEMHMCFSDMIHCCWRYVKI